MPATAYVLITTHIVYLSKADAPDVGPARSFKEPHAEVGVAGPFLSRRALEAAMTAVIANGNTDVQAWSAEQVKAELANPDLVHRLAFETADRLMTFPAKKKGKGPDA